MRWSHGTVVVTGAGGFIGSHLVERLVGLGARTRALLRYNAANSGGWLDRSPVKDEVELFFGDIRDPESLQRAFRDAEVVFHLAALIGVPYSYHTPLSYVRTNIEGTVNVLQVAAEADAKLIVHTSTSEVYGSARYVPIDEHHPLQGQSPYAASKIAADKFVEAFHRTFGIPVVMLRPFNTFGPRQSARAVIPTIILQSLADQRIRLGNVSPTRDLNYVSDIVEGYIRAAETPSAAVGRTLNLGSGREISIEDLARMIATLVGRPIDIEEDRDRVRPEQSEVGRLVADHTAARAVLGWQPSVSLEEGLRMTIEWFKEHRDGYRPSVYVL